MPDQMLITDGILITWEEPNQILEGQALLVEDGLISAIGPQADLLALHPQVDAWMRAASTSCRATSAPTPTSTALSPAGWRSPARLPRIFPRS